MKQFKINAIYKATEALSDNKDLSCDLKWSIYKLRKILLPHVEFHDETYNGIREKYTKFADNEGKIYGKHLEDFTKDIYELNNMEKELEDIQKIKINLKDLKTIDVHTMEALEDVVEFIEE